MEDQVEREKSIHGRQWEALHNGYFSKSEIAKPFITEVKRVLVASLADVVADLGGGTGFMLSQLALDDSARGAALVNLDCSEAQLAVANRAGISSVCASISDFRRGDIAAEDKLFLFIMRSVLHYHGEKGLTPLLRHLRRQACRGEYLVHQSAAFETAEEAACLNLLYREMRTIKWYTTINDLKDRLAETGWRVVSDAAAAPIPLNSGDLARRYGLDAEDISRICRLIPASYGEKEGIFRLTPSGFEAYLHYRIYTCRAAQMPANGRV
jgi:hypothetical protein